MQCCLRRAVVTKYRLANQLMGEGELTREYSRSTKSKSVPSASSTSSCPVNVRTKEAASSSNVNERPMTEAMSSSTGVLAQPREPSLSARRRVRAARGRRRSDCGGSLSDPGTPARQFAFELRQVAAVAGLPSPGLADWGARLRGENFRVGAGQTSVIAGFLIDVVRLPTFAVYAMRSMENVPVGVVI